MVDRIAKLTEMTKDGKMFVLPVATQYSREDYFLSENERDVKRICEYILNQQPIITEYSCFTGFFRFVGSVIGDAFSRVGILAEKYCRATIRL